MTKESLKLALESAYLAGFNASGEGYNGEYPFGDKNQNPEQDAVWIKDRDNALQDRLAHCDRCGKRGILSGGLPGEVIEELFVLFKQGKHDQVLERVRQVVKDAKGVVL